MLRQSTPLLAGAPAAPVSTAVPRVVALIGLGVAAAIVVGSIALVFAVQAKNEPRAESKPVLWLMVLSECK